MLGPLVRWKGSCWACWACCRYPEKRLNSIYPPFLGLHVPVPRARHLWDEQSCVGVKKIVVLELGVFLTGSKTYRHLG